MKRRKRWRLKKCTRNLKNTSLQAQKAHLFFPLSFTAISLSVVFAGHRLAIAVLSRMLALGI